MTTPFVVVFVLVIMLIGLCFYEYSQIQTQLTRIDDGVQKSVISVVTRNWDNVYQGVREGYAGGYTKEKEHDIWSEILKKENIELELKEILDLQVNSGTGAWERRGNNGKLIFSIAPSSAQAKIINTPLNGAPGTGIVVETEHRVTVDWAFNGAWGDGIPPITVTLKTKAGYTPKF